MLVLFAKIMSALCFEVKKFVGEVVDRGEFLRFYASLDFARCVRYPVTLSAIYYVRRLEQQRQPANVVMNRW